MLGNAQEKENKKEENITSLPSTETEVVDNYYTPLSLYALIQLLDFY